IREGFVEQRPVGEPELTILPQGSILPERAADWAWEVMVTSLCRKEVAAEGVVQVGLIGRGIARSRTPKMHMGEAQAQQLSAIYRIHDMDDPANAGVSFAQMLDRLEANEYMGVNVTYPFKI